MFLDGIHVLQSLVRSQPESWELLWAKLCMIVFQLCNWAETKPKPSYSYSWEYLRQTLTFQFSCQNGNWRAQLFRAKAHYSLSPKLMIHVAFVINFWSWNQHFRWCYFIPENYKETSKGKDIFGKMVWVLEDELSLFETVYVQVSM